MNWTNITPEKLPKGKPETRTEKLIYCYLEYTQGCGQSPMTQKRNYYTLNRFAGWLKKKDLRDLDKPDIIDYHLYLTGFTSQTGCPLNPNSILTEMAGLSSFFLYLYENEFILMNPMVNLGLKTAKTPKRRKVFTREDMALFLEGIGITKPDEQRDRAIFELIYSSGLRAGEVIALEQSRINLKQRILLVRGKGKKDRYLPFSKTAARFLVKYLSDGRKQHLTLTEGSGKDYFFLRPKGDGRIGYEYLRHRFKGYLERFELDMDYKLHSIRHATATHLMSAGASIRYVQELLGHVNLRTTQIYTTPLEDKIKSVYQSYHPRENDYYQEVDPEYLKELNKLKERLIKGQEGNRGRRKGSSGR